MGGCIPRPPPTTQILLRGARSTLGSKVGRFLRNRRVEAGGVTRRDADGSESRPYRNETLRSGVGGRVPRPPPTTQTMRGGTRASTADPRVGRFLRNRRRVAGAWACRPGARRRFPPIR